VNRLYQPEPLSSGYTKPFYKYVKDLKGTDNEITSIENNDGILTHDKTKISNTLNGFFFSVFTTPSPSVYLPLHHLYQNYYQSSVTEKDNIVVTKEGVVSLLRQLVQGKAPGVDGFTKNYLTVDLDQTAEILV